MTAHPPANEEEVQDDHDFVAVTASRTKTNINARYKRNNKGKGRFVPHIEKSLSELLQQKVEALQGSSFLKACKDMLNDNLNTLTSGKCMTCLCFGLGSFRHSPKSLLQLALLQLLLQCDTFEMDAKPISMDPDFNSEDVELLESLGHQVIDYREDILDLAENTFLYMPHCPRWLYEQLLELNKDKIEKMILLSNDLSLYAEREIRADELKKIPRLRQLGNSLLSFTLPEYEERPDAFNDMAWQWTDQSKEQTGADGKEISANVDELTNSVSSLSVNTPSNVETLP